MLSENIKNLRKLKGFSQEEMAAKLNVVRQTVSKWENGLSVPDSETLVKIAAELEVSTNILLGESVADGKVAELQAMEQKLEILTEQFAQYNKRQRKIWRAIFFSLWMIAIGYIAKEFVCNIYYLIIKYKMNADSAIIGGISKPTEIYVLGNGSKIGKIFAFCISIVIFTFGVYEIRRK